MADCDVVTSDDALCEELDEIERRRNARGLSGGAPVDHATETHDQRSRRLCLTALCLSGGGIRSAAFCLGVLQVLAQRRLLREFDYLSTVSGGGFIGSWLQILMREAGSIMRVEGQVTDTQSDAVRRLRSYTNYLTPQTGPFSADTWAGIVLYLRNLLINWAVFAPLFVVLALLPIFHRTALWAASESPQVNLGLLVLASAGLLLAVYQGCSLIPSHRQTYGQAPAIIWTIVAPALVWTLAIPSLVEYGIRLGGDWIRDADHRLFKLWALPAVYLAVTLMAYWLAWWVQKRNRSATASLFTLNLLPWCIASAGSAGLLGLVLYLADSVLPIEIDRTQADDAANIFQLMGLPFTVDLIERPVLVDTETALTVFAPLVLAIAYLLQTALYVAMRRGDPRANLDRYDLDREWLARVSGLILRVAVAWTVFSFCCLVLPVMTRLVQDGAWNTARMATAGSLAAAFGSLAAWLGKIAPNARKLIEQPGFWPRIQPHVPDAIAVLFAILLLMVFGSLEQSVLGQLQQFVIGLNWPGSWTTDSPWLPLLLQLLMAAALAAAVWFSGAVNVNRFSMHAVYRNRLTRAFLGSARPSRDPDPFTGFDPHDNPPLAELRNAIGPFQVINMALNITAGSNAAWAERKAASFTATPLTCGSPVLDRRETGGKPVSGKPAGAFVRTNRFAGVESRGAAKLGNTGPTLGTVLTVSGAAISPNWGYHSSRLTAFLMTLFNVRLGVWLPNPAKARLEDLPLAKPRNSLTALMNELIGRTTDTSEAINLSDGGHFDNLGLYEMLRRRCRTILVIDADTDPDCAMFDLGDAIRKASIDLGVAVTMHRTMRIYSRAQLEKEKDLHPLGIAMGTIRYRDGLRGRLLYVKPTLLADIPAEIRAYAVQNKAFPHEPITDQWFSESQFESYRGLGACQLGSLTGLMHDTSLAALFRTANLLTRGKRVVREAPVNQMKCVPPLSCTV